jgi:hypothetical protein
VFEYHEEIKRSGANPSVQLETAVREVAQRLTPSPPKYCPTEKRVLYIPTEEEDAWYALVEKFKCSSCLDVRAASCILPCSHSYCGDCLHTLQHPPKGKKADYSCCPECRESFPVDSETYERDMDLVTESEVSMAPDCEAKTDWYDRRQKYLTMLEAKRVTKLADAARLVAWDEVERRAVEEGVYDVLAPRRHHMVVAVVVALFFGIGAIREVLSTHG